AARSQAALGCRDRRVSTVDRRWRSDLRRTLARRSVGSLVVSETRAACFAERGKSGLGFASGRSVHRREARTTAASAEWRGAEEPATAPSVSGPDRLAPDARRDAGVSGGCLAGCLRKSRRSLVGQPAVWRALGPALDGRVAVQRLGRLRRG